MTLESKPAANESDEADNENDIDSDASDNAEDEQE